MEDYPANCDFGAVELTKFRTYRPHELSGQIALEVQLNGNRHDVYFERVL
jgi:hypothetical protein